MKIIGRKKEIKILHNALESKKSELVAVYGRRRVGKTFLIREVLQKQIIIDVTGLYKGSLKEQLINFHNQLPTKEINTPKDWFEAFEILKKYIDSIHTETKKVIFIDEFPWMATTRSKFLMWFENFWNSYCTKRTDLVIVICGSAASYMVKNIISNKGGLHNRVTARIKLDPFNLNETKLFLQSQNITLEHYDILQLYMAIGGVPYYLEKIKKGYSVTQNIDRLCFEKGGELATEFQEIFISLFSNSNIHTKMVRALAKSQKGITKQELLRKCELKQNGFTSNILHELIESGFITLYTPFGKKNRNSLVRLSDEYSMFYIKFIEPHINQGAGTWNKLSKKQTTVSWYGYAFETICLKHIQQIKNKLGIGGVFSLNSSWFNKEAQIDLVIDRDDQRINLCEINFYNRPFSIDKAYYAKLQNKINEFKDDTNTRKGVYLTLITTFGVKQNKYSLGIVENELFADCLFDA